MSTFSGYIASEGSQITATVHGHCEPSDPLFINSSGEIKNYTCERPARVDFSQDFAVTDSTVDAVPNPRGTSYRPLVFENNGKRIFVQHRGSLVAASNGYIHLMATDASNPYDATSNGTPVSFNDFGLNTNTYFCEIANEANWTFFLGAPNPGGLNFRVRVCTINPTTLAITGGAIVDFAGSGDFPSNILHVDTIRVATDNIFVTVGADTGNRQDWIHVRASGTTPSRVTGDSLTNNFVLTRYHNLLEFVRGSTSRFIFYASYEFRSGFTGQSNFAIVDTTDPTGVTPSYTFGPTFSLAGNLNISYTPTVAGNSRKVMGLGSPTSDSFVIIERTINETSTVTGFNIEFLKITGSTLSSVANIQSDFQHVTFPGTSTQPDCQRGRVEATYNPVRQSFVVQSPCSGLIEEIVLDVDAHTIIEHINHGNMDASAGNLLAQQWSLAVYVPSIQAVVINQAPERTNPAKDDMRGYKFVYDDNGVQNFVGITERVARYNRPARIIESGIVTNNALALTPNRYVFHDNKTNSVSNNFNDRSKLIGLALSSTKYMLTRSSFVRFKSYFSKDHDAANSAAVANFIPYVGNYKIEVSAVGPGPSSVFSISKALPDSTPSLVTDTSVSYAAPGAPAVTLDVAWPDHKAPEFLFANFAGASAGTWYFKIEVL